MPAPVLLRNAQDSSVESKSPKKNFNNAGKMFLQDGAFGYLYFSRPFPLGARITSAKLRVCTGMAYAGNVSMKLNRVTSEFKANRVTWDNKPTVADNTITVTKSNPGARTEWEFNVKSMMQFISDGAAWYGFRLEMDGSARKWIHSTQSTVAALRPVLEIEWSDAPDAPSDLSPEDEQAIGTRWPTLRFDFTDIGGDTEMRAYQIRIGNSNMTTIDYDSGTKLSSDPSCDLSQTSYAGLPENGSLRYWQVRVQDGAEEWSDWSTIASMKYLVKPTLTLNSPSPDGNGVVKVTDSTPQIVWTLSSTQTSYRVRLLDPESLEVLWNSGRVTGNDNGVEIPKKIIKTIGSVYRVEVRVWDNQNRASTPGDNAYVQVTRDFTYASGTATPVSNLTATRSGGWPWWNIEFTIASAPDSFKLFRDGVLVEDGIEPEDVAVVGEAGKYRIVDTRVQGRMEHKWRVACVVNKNQSQNDPTVTKYTKNETAWIMDLDGGNAIPLLNAVFTSGLAEASEVLHPQDAPPVLITQSQWGEEGTGSGEISADWQPVGLTAKQMRDRFISMRNKPGRKRVLMWSDKAIEALVYQMKDTSISRPDGSTDYAVSFSFVQTDF